ncbi:catalase HPII, partial [Streptomyces sp. MBT67]|nr:catalase HPII [Streptomyces sp. MBT67]
APSPALSQLGQTWPLDGRVIGIVADTAADLDGVRTVRQAVLDGGMVPLVIAPHGGTIGPDDDPVTVQRTFTTARSTEFDALLVAGAPAPGADGFGARDAKAGDAQPSTTDPRLLLLLNEAFRHGKAIGHWGDADAVLAQATIPNDAPGVVGASSATGVLDQVLQLLGDHRVWDRFPTTI